MEAAMDVSLSNYDNRSNLLQFEDLPDSIDGVVDLVSRGQHLRAAGTEGESSVPAHRSGLHYIYI